MHPFPGISDHQPAVFDVDLSKAVSEEFEVDLGLALLKPRAEPENEKEIQVTATLQANDHEGIKAAVGKTLAVRGKVQNIGRTRSGSIQFLNFQGNERGQFVGIVKKENLVVVEEVLGIGLKPGLTGGTLGVRVEVVFFKDFPELWC